MADRLLPPQVAEMSCYSVAEEITSVCADSLEGIRTSDLRSAGTRALQIVVRDVALGTPEALATRTTLEQALGKAGSSCRRRAAEERRLLPVGPKDLANFGEILMREFCKTVVARMGGKTVKRSQGEIVAQQMVKNAILKGKPPIWRSCLSSSRRTRRARPRARR